MSVIKKLTKLGYWKQGGVGYSAQAQAAFDNIESGSSETLTDEEKTALARFIDFQVLAGNWSKIYAFIPLSGLSTSAKARVNWINGVLATLIDSPTYAASTGFTTDGTDDGIDTKVNPSTINSGSSVPLDGTFYGFHCIENLGTFRAGVVGTTATGQALMAVTQAGAYTTKHHTDSTGSLTNTTYIGLNDDFYMLSRTGSTLYSRMKDGQNIQTQAHASKTVPAGRNIYLGGYNSGSLSSPAASRYGSMVVGNSSGFNFPAFFFSWELMMMELGVKTQSPLYETSVANYSASDALLVNSEGQSNALFAGAANGPTGIDVLDDPMPDVYNFNRLNFANPLVIDSLDYGVNNSYDDLGKYAGGLRFIYEISQKQNLKTYLWHYCISGTILDPANTDDWYPDNSFKLFYDSHTRIGAEGVPLITETIRKIVWHWGQGEGDCGAGTTEEDYRTWWYYYLSEKIDALEGYGLDLSVSKLHIIVPQVWIGLSIVSAPGRDEVRAAQASFSVAGFEAAYPAHAGKVESITVYNSDKIIHSDGVHLDGAGYMIEGYRLANYVLGL